MNSTIDKYSLSETAIAEACHAWQVGGTLGLGHWLAQYKPKFTTTDYGALVQLVRAELGDNTDYSLNPHAAGQ